MAVHDKEEEEAALELPLSFGSKARINRSTCLFCTKVEKAGIRAAGLRRVHLQIAEIKVSKFGQSAVGFPRRGWFSEFPLVREPTQP